MVAEFDWIESLAVKFQVRVLFTKCNPEAGDPADCFDVEFIPLCCSKDQAVAFLMEEMNVPEESIFAFGDSENDFPMFERAGQAYLVANADRVAIKKHGSCLDKPYCHGILSVMQKIQS